MKEIYISIGILIGVCIGGMWASASHNNAFEKMMIRNGQAEHNAETGRMQWKTNSIFYGEKFYPIQNESKKDL